MDNKLLIIILIVIAVLNLTMSSVAIADSLHIFKQHNKLVMWLYALIAILFLAITGIILIA